MKQLSLFDNIQIRAWYGDWKEVTREEALEYARKRYNNITCIKKGSDLVRYVNTSHIRGTEFTQEELEDVRR